MLTIIGSVSLFILYGHRNDDMSLQFSGNIEVTEAQMSFRISGRLQERLVEEGDAVVTGNILAKLENSDQTIALAQATANLAFARAVLAELTAGSRQEDIDRSAGPSHAGP